ncbi:MAG: hypothetical protein P4L27_07815 [Ignavibacteriaceae bacterium]|nr:hypothetical protein [Ignavibacteriaceae bacterium]
MGKALLIFLLGSMAIFGVYNLFNNQNIKTSLQSSINYYGDIQTRNIGNSMMQMIFSNLADHPSWRVSYATATFFNGSANYSVVGPVSFNGDSNLVKATVYAKYNGTDTNIVKPKILVAYFHANSQTIPSFMNYALFTGSDLSMSGNVSIVPASGYNGNANVQVNGNLAVSGNASIINGFLTYSNNEAGKLNNIVQPVNNPDNLPAYSKVPAVNVPTFNPNDYLGVATKVYAGNVTFNGPIALGTKENPSVIIVQGNLTLASATFTGYGSILVTQNIALSGGNRLTTQDTTGSSLALYVAGNLAMSGNSEIDANMIVLGNVAMSGTPTIIGNLITPKPVALSGTANIEYKPPVISISQSIWNSAAARPSDVRYYWE